MKSHITDLISKWSTLENEWGVLVRTMQEDTIIQNACILAWEYASLRITLVIGFKLLDQLSENGDFIKPPETYDETIDKEFILLQETCNHWSETHPISKACRRMSTLDPYISTQRILYHKYPKLRHSFKFFNSCLDHFLRDS